MSPLISVDLQEGHMPHPFNRIAMHLEQTVWPHLMITLGIHSCLNVNGELQPGQFIP
jgi:hypothetical protein